MARKSQEKSGVGESPATLQNEGCPISAFFTVFGKPYMMDTIYALITAKGPMRFADLQAAVPTTAGTLSERLKELVLAGLATRTPYAEVPPRVEYSATPLAMSLEPIFARIGEWAKANPLPVDALRE